MIKFLKRMPKVYKQSLKYCRRIDKLQKSLNILLREYGKMTTSPIEEREQFISALEIIHRHSEGLLNEFENYVESNKIRSNNICK